MPSAAPAPAPATAPTRSFSMSSAMSSSSTLFRSPTQGGLDEIKLSHVLNGETCPPISFPDFASFVTHKEFTTENLLFVIWYRSYEARFSALPDKDRLGIPVPSARLRDRYAPFAYLDKAIAEGMVQSRASSMDVRQNTPPRKHAARVEYPDESGVEWKRCGWTVDGQSACQCGDASHRHGGAGGASRNKWNTLLGHGMPSTAAAAAAQNERINGILKSSSTHPPLPPVGTTLIPPEAQQMRQEAERAFATFLRKGGSRELGISDELRQFAKDCLKRSTAPECFLPIYEEIYSAVENQSLPHFLSVAKTNINRPKQRFWYIVGLVDMLIGIVIFTLISILVSQRNFGFRLLRLPSAIFTSFGAMQFYSASRGFCTQVWGRTSRQIRPWEMDEVAEDEEEAIEVLDPLRSTGTAVETEKDIEVVTPPAIKEEEEIELGEGVHPLADLSGHGFSLDLGEDEGKEEVIMLPVIAHHRALSAGANEGDEMSAEARARLAARRSTIKAPAADLAFPIVDSPPPLHPTRFDRDISPFGEPDPISITVTAPRVGGGAARTGPHAAHQPTSVSASPDIPHSATLPPAPALELGTLLGKFRRAEPSNPVTYKANEKKREKQVKIFGPEKLVEDPRVVALMKSIIRDILIVGAVSAVVTIALCFGVPMAGLA